jgi:histidine triad (HIT) family protein
MADACIFCDIVAKKAPADIVHEDDDVVVIKNIEPLAPVHLLVLPKDHYPNLDSLSDDTLFTRMVWVARKVGNQQSPEKGYRLGINSAKQADIGHVHIHVLGGLDKETAL